MVTTSVESGNDQEALPKVDSSAGSEDKFDTIESVNSTTTVPTAKEETPKSDESDTVRPTVDSEVTTAVIETTEFEQEMTEANEQNTTQPTDVEGSGTEIDAETPTEAAGEKQKPLKESSSVVAEPANPYDQSQANAVKLSVSENSANNYTVDSTPNDDVVEGSGEVATSLVPEVNVTESVLNMEPDLMMITTQNVVEVEGSGESPTTQDAYAVTTATDLSRVTKMTKREETLTESSTTLVPVEETGPTPSESNVVNDKSEVVEPETHPFLFRLQKLHLTAKTVTPRVEGTAQVSVQEPNSIAQRALSDVQMNTVKSSDATVHEKWHPFIMDCSNEVDDRGSELCIEWAVGRPLHNSTERQCSCSVGKRVSALALQTATDKADEYL